MFIRYYLQDHTGTTKITGEKCRLLILSNQYEYICREESVEIIRPRY